MENSFDSKEDASFGGEDLIIQPSDSQIMAEEQAKRKASHNSNDIPLRPSELRDSTAIQPSNESVRYTTTDDKFGLRQGGDTSQITQTNQSIQAKFDLKVILVGDISVGKTSVLGRFIDNKFSTEYKCTVGSDTKVKYVQIDQNNFAKISIWDTAGEEKFRAVTKNYFKDAQGALIVFDLTNKETFIKLSEWIEFVNESSPADVVITLVGNKSDLDKQRKVSFEEGVEYSKILECDYTEVSAKNGNNISLIFEKMINKMISNQIEKEKKELEELAKMPKDKSMIGTTSTISGRKMKISNIPGRKSIRNKKGGCC